MGDVGLDTAVNETPPPRSASQGLSDSGRGLLAAAAVASIGAGAIHAVAAGAHNDARQAMWTFALLATAQIAWGAAALARPSRIVAAVGAVVSIGALAGWMTAVAVGIPWIDGMDVAIPVGQADGLAAVLAAITLLTSVVAMYGLPSPRLVAPVLGVLALIAAVPGMAMAATHDHGHSVEADGHDHGAEVADGAEDHADHLAAAVPPTPYDPALPIDLGGVEGVTPQQQAAAENLVSATILGLPQFADPAVAEAAGFRSIGDGATGHEHYINRAYINDDKILDPNYPESLVYQMIDGEKTLAAAMYMLGSEATLDDVPELGGTLTQWHIHDNLCYTPDPVAPRVAGLREPGGPCRPPLVPGGENPMIHVWIIPHECGPFAALTGVGGGAIAEGEERWCDHAHGA